MQELVQYNTGETLEEFNVRCRRATFYAENTEARFRKNNPKYPEESPEDYKKRCDDIKASIKIRKEMEIAKRKLLQHLQRKLLLEAIVEIAIANYHH